VGSERVAFRREDARVRYPGERTPETRHRNLREGIPVDEATWKWVCGLQLTSSTFTCLRTNHAETQRGRGKLRVRLTHAATITQSCVTSSRGEDN
jgi:hypothetical protein